MSSTVNSINNILRPVLFQVIGTTPESLVESIKRSGLEGKMETGVQLASVSLFAAAVNKAVLGEFLMRSELAGARQTVVNQFSIKNQANMTALTLFGHCLYLSPFASEVEFATEFRKKMGQQNIWDGSLEGGSLSETQRKILAEKSKSINKNSAKLFATGFFKFIRADPRDFTAEEASFWDVQRTSAVVTPPRPSSSRAQSVTPPSSQNTSVTLSTGNEVIVSTKAFNYYMAINNNDMVRFEASVTRDGPQKWSTLYESAATKDPELKGSKGAGTVVG